MLSIGCVLSLRCLKTRNKTAPRLDAVREWSRSCCPARTPASGSDTGRILTVLGMGIALALTGVSREASAANVCDRTVQVRDAIVAARGGAACAELTLHHLREITTLDLSEQSIASLRAGDFDGLVRLDALDLSGNLLTSLPAGVFDELYLLKSVRLDGNLLETLPGDVFDELFLLEELTLHGNRFTSLPDGLFEDFSRFAGMQANGTAPDNSGPYPRISRFLERHEVTSPEEFIAVLPPLYLKRFLLMFDSESPARPHVSGEHPRVISWGADGDFIFSWNTDPDAPTMFRESVEFLRQNESGWSVGVIDFSGATPEITEPASCQSCHGSLGKPLWGEWNVWKGSEYVHAGSEHFDPNAAGYMRSAVASSHPRIEPMDFAASSFEGTDNFRVLNLPGQVPHLYAVVEAGAVWSWRHAEVLLSALKQRRSDVAQMGEALMCDPFPQFPVLRHFDHGEHNLAISADLELALDRKGAIASPRYSTLVRYGYYYHLPGTLPGAVNFLMFADLWEDNAMVRRLYRQTPNDRTVPSGANFAYVMLHYPSGSATAEDELIQKLRLHFGRGGLRGLETRGRQNQRVHLGGTYSADFWSGHLRPMRSRVCSAIRDSRPRDLRAAAAGADVGLNWQAPTYDPGGLTGYRILRAAGGGDLEVLVADTDSTGTTWTDEGPGAGVYRYAVQALYDDLYASRESGKVRASVGDGAGTAAPAVTSGATFTVTEGDTAVGVLTAADEDTAAGDLAWSFAGGADQASFTLSPAGVLAFASAKDYESPDDTGRDGAYEVTVRVSDGRQSGAANLSVTLSNRNEAPTANAGADQDGVAEGATVSLGGSGADPDVGDTLRYAWTQTSGASVRLAAMDAASTSFRAPSDLSAAETLRFRLRVTDGAGLFAEDEVAVTVVAAESAAPAVTSGATFTVTEGDTAVGVLTAADEDTAAGDLAWSFAGGADQASFTLSPAGVLAFASAKDYESPDDTGRDGAYEVTVRVSDGRQSGAANLSVTLSNRNEAPTANAGADQDGVAEGATVSLGGSGADPDVGDTLRYAWTQTSGASVRLAAMDAASTSFRAPSDLSAAETVRFRLRVTDGAGLFAEDEVAVTVVAAESAAPAVTSGATFTVTEGDTAVGVLTAADEDTAAGDLAWSFAGGADQASFTLSPAGVLAFASAKDYESPDDTGRDGAYEVTVRVSDGRQSGAANLSVTLSNRNEAPTANAGADQDGVAEGATVSLGGSGADPDVGDTLRYAWTQTSGASVRLAAMDAASTSFRAPSDLSAAETLRFTLRVTDEGGLYAEDEVAVTGAASQAPLTAWAEQLPARHDGSSRFTFELHFTEDVKLGYATLRDSAFRVTGGTVVGARRQSPPSNQSWYIDVEPDSDAAVELVLLAGRACDAAGAICTADQRRLSNRLELTVAGPPPPPPVSLTARVEGVPESHGGTAFRFRLRFSAEIAISYVTLRDTSFDVTGGSVIKARRLAPPSNAGWEITVSPERNAEVRLVLAANRPCGAAGAICTAGGERLSNRLEIAVPAQP